MPLLLQFQFLFDVNESFRRANKGKSMEISKTNCNLLFIARRCMTAGCWLPAFPSSVIDCLTFPHFPRLSPRWPGYWLAHYSPDDDCSCHSSRLSVHVYQCALVPIRFHFAPKSIALFSPHPYRGSAIRGHKLLIYLNGYSISVDQEMH